MKKWSLHLKKTVFLGRKLYCCHLKIATILDKSPWDSTAIFIFFCHFSVPSTQCILFEIFFAVLPPPTQLGNNSGYTRPTLIVWGVRGGVGPVCICKRPRNVKVSQDFCPRLSEKEVGRKKAILSVFQACKSVFSGFWWKIVNVF